VALFVMQIEELGPAARHEAAALWEATGLTRPWNDPLHDFDRTIDGPTSAVLGMSDDERRLVATAMVGNDRHRGWVYYLAVDPSHRSRGLGGQMIESTEAWLGRSGATKVQLMVRHGQAEAGGFYERLGYEDAEVQVLARWL
jgi:ribosomal protein S18 acetylase RimI-like enzyme